MAQNGAMVSSKNIWDFDPTSVAGCVLWLDGADSNTIVTTVGGSTPVTVGGSVAQWRDKSILANHANNSTTGVTQPTRGADNSLNFIGVSAQFLQLANAGAAFLPTGATDGTYFTVSRQIVASTANSTIFSHGAVGDSLSRNISDRGGVIVSAVITQGTTDNGVNPNSASQLGVPSATVIHITTLNVNNRIASLWVSGTPANTTNVDIQNTRTVVNTGTTSAFVGRPLMAGGAVFYTGNIYEILVFNTTLSHTNRQMIEGYLAWKWGVQNSLPISHPFNNNSVTPYFNPNNFGATLWYDAADSSSVFPNTVYQWNDKSGQNNHVTQSNLSLCPVYSAANGITFDGYFERMFFTTPSFLAGVNFTFFVVERRTISKNTGYFISGDGLATNANLHAGWVGDTASLRFFSNDFGGTSLGTYTSPVIRVWRLKLDTSQRRIFIDGTLNASNSTVTKLISYVGGGIGGSPFGSYQGDILEMICYTDTTVAATSDANDQTIEGYLAWKWGTQGALPAGHPHKSAAPVAFSPTSVSGSVCRLWLDAADTATILRTVHWTNKTGLTAPSRHAGGTTGTTGNASYETNIVNGQNAILCANNLEGIRLNHTDSTNFSFTAGQISFFVVSKSSAARSITDFGFFQRFSIYLAKGEFGEDILQYSLLGATSSNQTLTPPLDGDTIMLGVTSTGLNSTGRVHINGSLVSTMTTGSTGGTAINPVLSRDSSAGSTHYCEIIGIRTLVTTTQRQQIEGYLAWKWGLQGKLPATHPYALANYFYQNTRPFSRNFAPTDISDCIMWYDGADLTSMFTNTAGTTGATGSGNIIRLWADKSRSGNDLTNGATGPTLTTSTNPRGFDMVFNGTSAFLEKTGFVNNSDTYTKFLVFNRADINSAFYRLFLYRTVVEQSNTDITGFHLQEGSPANSISVFKARAGSTEPVISRNTYYVITIVSSPIRLDFYLNGNLTPNGSITSLQSTNFNGTYFSISKAGNQCFPGFINEVISYNRQLSITEYQQVEGYLAWKWGLNRSLPVAHPFYKYQPPASTPNQPELRLYKTVFNPYDIQPTLWLDSSDTTTYATTNNRLTSWSSKGSQSLTFTPPNIPYMLEIPTGTTIPTGATGTTFTLSRTVAGVGTMTGLTVTVGGTGISNCTLVGGSPTLTTGSSVTISNGAAVTATRYSITIRNSTTTTGGTGTTSFILNAGPTGTGSISGVQSYIRGVPIPNCTFTAGSTGFSTGASTTIPSGADVVVQPGPLINVATRGTGLDKSYTDFTSGGTFKLTAGTNTAYNASAITLTALSVALDGLSIVVSSSPSVTLFVGQPIIFNGSGTVIPGTTNLTGGSTYFIRSVSTLDSGNVNFPTNYISLWTNPSSGNITGLTPGTLSSVTAQVGAYNFTFTTSIPHNIPNGAPVVVVLDSHQAANSTALTGTFFGNIQSVPTSTTFTFLLTSNVIGIAAGTSTQLVGNVQYGDNSIISGSLGSTGTTLTLTTAMPHNLQTGFIAQPYFFGPSLPSQWAPYSSATVRAGTSTFSGTINATTLSVSGGTPPGIGAVLSGSGVTTGTYVVGILTYGSSYQLSVSSSVPTTTTITSTYNIVNSFSGSISGTALTFTGPTGTAPVPGMMLRNAAGLVTTGTYIVSGTSPNFTVNISHTATGTITMTASNYSVELTFPSTNWPMLPVGLNNGGSFTITGSTGTNNIIVSGNPVLVGSIIAFTSAAGSIAAGAYYVASVSGNQITLSSSRTLTPVLSPGTISTTIPVWQYPVNSGFRLCSFGTSGMGGLNNDNASIVWVESTSTSRIVVLSGFSTLTQPTAGVMTMSQIVNPGIQFVGSGGFANQYIHGARRITLVDSTSFTIELSNTLNNAVNTGDTTSQTYGGVTYSGSMANFGFTDFRFGGGGRTGGFSFSPIATQAMLSYPANGYLLESSGTGVTNSFNSQTITALIAVHLSSAPIRVGTDAFSPTIISSAVTANNIGGRDVTSGGRDFAFRYSGQSQRLGVSIDHNNTRTNFIPQNFIDTTSCYRIFSVVFNSSATAMGDVASVRKGAAFNGYRYDTVSGQWGFNTDYFTSLSNTLTAATTLVPTIMRLGGDTVMYGTGINSGAFSAMGIAELMVFNTRLTLEQRQLLEGYLSQKYGCQNWLANATTVTTTSAFVHPYRTSRAIISPSIDVTQVYAQGLTTWFDAANSSTMTFASGINLDSWTTTGGNLPLTLLPNGTNYPTLVQSAQNGLPGVRFTTSGSTGTPMGAMVGGNNLNRFATISLNVEYTIIAVYKNTTYTASQAISNILALGASNQRLLMLTNQFNYRNATTQQVKNYTATVSGQAYMAVHFRRGNTMFARINGTLDNGGTDSGTNLIIPPAGLSFALTLGGYVSDAPSANPFAGDIYEHIVFRYALTNQEIFQIEGYLAWKWGLQTSLPTTHPYYRFQP